MIKDILGYQNNPSYSEPKWTEEQLNSATLKWLTQEWSEFQGETDDEDEGSDCDDDSEDEEPKPKRKKCAAPKKAAPSNDNSLKEALLAVLKAH